MLKAIIGVAHDPTHHKDVENPQINKAPQRQSDDKLTDTRKLAADAFRRKSNI